MERVLSVGEAVDLATVVEWAIHNARLGWVNESGDVSYGTARSIGDERGAHAQRSDDVRDCFLRITTDTGWEWFVPITEALERLRAGTLVQDSRG